ncbi:alpha/beta fold hydrolase [Actinacidiphila alni]|uniref:alpha/beta fold hydrolase n=1 Tax=Actinacidiphila alni TaxID=380248 RepID=UPI00340FD710
MRSFRADGLEFPVTDTGPRNGTPVVLLHGFPAGPACWSPVARVLTAAGLRTLSPLQRGYAPGARPGRARDYRLPLLAGDVLALLDAAGLDRAHIVGHDWGGAVAWALAERAPARVASLTAVSMPHPRALGRAALTSRQALLSWYLLFFQLPRLPEAVVTHNQGRTGARWLCRFGLDEATALGYARRFVTDRPSLTGALGWYRALPLDLRSGLRTGPGTVPTMLVWGTADAVISARSAWLTRRWVTGPYSFRPLAGATHWLPEQNADVLAELILQHTEAFPVGAADPL